VVIMLLAALGFWLNNIALLLGVLFLLGLQSTIFGPIKYGILPQILKKEELVGGNALIEMGTFVAILAGTIAGLEADVRVEAQLLLAILVTADELDARVGRRELDVGLPGGGGALVLLLPEALAPAEQHVAEALAIVAGQLAEACGIPKEEVKIQVVGPTWGAEISKKALQGLVVFLLLVSLFLSIYFEWRMAVAALVALAHDLVITVGIYALTGLEVTPATVIGLLTILGYSLYDTVIIYDRIRENEPRFNRIPYGDMVNLSIWETLTRSLNTTLTTLLPVLCLLFFGGGTLEDFAFALLVGILSGAYSSIFVASPVLTLLKEREPQYKKLKAAARADQA